MQSMSTQPFASAAEFEAAMSLMTALPAEWRKSSIDYHVLSRSKSLRSKLIAFGVDLFTDYEALLAREALYRDPNVPPRTFGEYVRRGLPAFKGSRDPHIRELRRLYGTVSASCRERSPAKRARQAA